MPSDDDLIRRTSASHPSLSRGRVWCRECGATLRVNSGMCLSIGWPKCCGFTMTIDSPEEQKRLAARDGGAS